jgi:hypothetical protein
LYVPFTFPLNSLKERSICPVLTKHDEHWKLCKTLKKTNNVYPWPNLDNTPDVSNCYINSYFRYRHEFKSQQLWAEIKFVLENFAQPFTELFNVSFMIFVILCTEINLKHDEHWKLCKTLKKTNNVYP